MTSPKQTKPFDPTRPVQTRDGWKARILATDLRGDNDHRIAAALTRPDGEEALYRFFSSGRMFTGREHGYDLINIPTKREGWIVVNFFDPVRRGEPIGSASLIYSTRDEAIKAAANVYNTIIRIEVEEP